MDAGTRSVSDDARRRRRPRAADRRAYRSTCRRRALVCLLLDLAPANRRTGRAAEQTLASCDHELTEASGAGDIEPGPDARATVFVLLAEDLTFPMDCSDDIASLVRNQQLHHAQAGTQAVADGDEQLVDAFAVLAEITTDPHGGRRPLGLGVRSSC